MKLVIDIEANGLDNPTKIWVVVCKDIDTGEYHVFRHPSSDEEVRKKLLLLLSKADLIIGHFILSYDLPVLQNLCGLRYDESKIIDTLVVSKLVDYSRQGGHSVADYGLEFGLEKINFTDFSKYSKEMEDYCVRDVDITHKIYLKYLDHTNDPVWRPSLRLEHEFQRCVNNLHSNGFSFNSTKASSLLEKVQEELNALDTEITRQFPPKLMFFREINPRVTKYGTLNKSDFRWHPTGDISEYNGGPFCHCIWKEFNPSSHGQLVSVLHEAGWKPVDKTQTHIETEREVNKLKHHPKRTNELDIRFNGLILKLDGMRKFGWKINEANLSTLPASAPAPARTLAKRILLESRRRTLTEWLGLVRDGPGTDKRIHGSFYGIGAWTHRMAHQKPNTANIPNEFNVHDGSKKLLGKELRALWRAPRNRLLVGVDAEGIQLRVFAHYINDPDLTNAIVNGKKSDKSDPHSFNQKVFGPCCKTRQASKHSLYAIFFGGGPSKIAQIMGCSREEAQEAIDNLTKRYPGLDKFQRQQFPIDAKRGYFIGLDGRRVPIPGDTLGDRKHLCMSGYLQNGEAIVMKKATLKWLDKLKDYDSKLVNMVHDEWQTEVPNNMEIALAVAKMQADSLAVVGEELHLNCPLAGSYWNDDKKDYTIGTNWSVTH